MTTTENSYTMPLLFGLCRKQGHCCLSAIGVVKGPAGSTLVGSKNKNINNSKSSPQ